MATVADVLNALESLAPKRFAFAWDKIGLQVGDLNRLVTRALVSLDRSLGAVAHAREIGAQLLVSHHPLIWEPLKVVDVSSHQSRTVMILIESGIAAIAAHTNWDAAQGGINDALASVLGLSEVKPFGNGAPAEALKLVFFCPAPDAQRLIDAVTEAGAGTIGDYTRCAFIGTGQGTFKPGPNANPTIGSPNEIETVDEARVETLVPTALKGRVVRALLKAHPYEEPAFDLIPITTTNQPMGRIGRLPAPMGLNAFSEHLELRLGHKCLAWGRPDAPIRSVAVVGGAAPEEWRAARTAGADAYVTGEVPQHIALEASESGLPILAAGHYATEQPGCLALRDRLQESVPDIDFHLFEPSRGENGRPL